MQYKGQYIYPPRPNGNIRPGCSFFNELQESKEWIAQFKLNGSNTQMVLLKDSPVFFNRHHAKSNYLPLSQQVEFFKSLKKYAPIVLNLECLNNKDKGVKNWLYVYDILVFKGEWLIGKSVKQRLEILSKILKSQEQLWCGQLCGPKIILAKTLYAWNKDLQIKTDHETFKALEGLVIKKLEGKLEPGFKEKNNTTWAIRCRV